MLDSGHRRRHVSLLNRLVLLQSRLKFLRALLSRELRCLELAHHSLIVLVNLKFVRLDAIHLLPDGLDAEIGEELFSFVALKQLRIWNAVFLVTAGRRLGLHLLDVFFVSRRRVS